MTTMIRAAGLGPPQTRTGPLPGQLLTAATVTDGPVRWQDGAGAVESANCLSLSNLYDACTPTGGKLFEAPNWANAVPLAAYGGLQCATVGFDQSDWGSRLSAAFKAMESVALERALMDKVLGGSNCPELVTPVDLATKGIDGLRLAVATLEAYAASHYAGTPVIHLPRALLGWLASNTALYLNGDEVSTVLGSKVVGGSYGTTKSPAGATPASGVYYLYVTGEVLVRRGPQELHSLVNPSTNTVNQLAEGLYMVGVDCFMGAVQVTGGPTLPVDATGATAGTPGTWTPAGSVPATKPEEMGGIVASPTTIWTAGQYVQTQQSGVTGRVYWDGLRWQQGASPGPSTGATAGIPGAFTPAGTVPPATVAAMTGLTASPATAWTAGQYVQTRTPGTAGQARWNGTAWVAAP